MLFNSYQFIFVFFPLVLVGFFLIGRFSIRAAAGFLAVVSLFFYGWWSVDALPLLAASICVNYALGWVLTPVLGGGHRRPKAWIAFAVALNLGVLAVFKYADFFIDNLNAALSGYGISQVPLMKLILPIGISFYTFTQIAFLVDCWQGKVRERSFVHYVLFVTYFPHLVAGPVLHHAQMMPQFARSATYRPASGKLALGLAVFTAGLAKKMLIADPLGQYSDLVFDGVRGGIAPSLLSSWFGALAYTMQIYFDFSGYSDMAIGLSLCFGVKLPANFSSPYRAASIVEFWRRWHISLSTFLRDYLYVPLGGNRKGPGRRYVNLFATMLLGGLWHGAAWTFVAWGALHGAYLAANHYWIAKFGGTTERRTRLSRYAGWAVTFFAVVAAWVVFRAESLTAATSVYAGMLGLNGSDGAFREFSQLPFGKAMFFRTLLIAMAIAFAFPRAMTICRWARRATVSIGSAGRQRAATMFASFACVGVLAVCVSKLGSYSPFLYFQF